MVLGNKFPPPDCLYSKLKLDNFHCYILIYVHQPACIIFFYFDWAFLIGIFLFGPEKEVDLVPKLNLFSTNIASPVMEAWKKMGFQSPFWRGGSCSYESGHPAIVPAVLPQVSWLSASPIPIQKWGCPTSRRDSQKKRLSFSKTGSTRVPSGKALAYEPVKAPDFQTNSQRQAWEVMTPKRKHLLTIRSEATDTQGLFPAPIEDPMRLLRRVALDITGLPPSQTLARDFSTGKLSYEQAVDQLLDSELMVKNGLPGGLTLPRYADTKGYERDVSRTFWPYRDWVIRSFNADKPYDEFTIEQLAGTCCQPYARSIDCNCFSSQYDE